jgi:chromate transport protein ChrA
MALTELQGTTTTIKEQKLRDIAFKEALAVWIRIGFLSFGGPAGQIALMHRIIVDVPS